MMRALAHRGPDGTGLWCSGEVGLGHLMLHTTPESLHEHMPLRSEHEDLVLIADARIDNREELLRLLQPRRRDHHAVTDSDLILAAYQKWGESSPERLLGAFAFAIWDSRRQHLFCARDHFGVKPFYYYHAPARVFALASEVKALLALEEVPETVDEVTIAEHLLVPVEKSPTRTYYQHVSSLAPAHSLTVGPDGFRIRCYWSLDPSRELTMSSDQAYAEAFRERFVEAVRCRMRSAFPVGSMLSGGMDSSSITCTAAQLHPQILNGRRPLSTLSAVFPSVSACDERPYIRAVVQKYALDSHFFRADEVSPLSKVDRMHWHLDRALGGGNLYINWNLYGAASSGGARVVLDGWDGDTTVSHGIYYFRELKQAGRWVALAREVKSFADKLDEPWRPALWSWLRGPILRTTGLAYARQLGRVLTRVARGQSTEAPPPVWQRVLSPDFTRRMEIHLQDPPAIRSERAHHYFRLTDPAYAHTHQMLNTVAGASHVDVRYPFWDKRLVEFCLSLPPEQKMYRGWSRMVLRRAMEGLLPEKVRWRGGKTNLTPSFDHGLLTFEQQHIRDLADRPEAIESYVDPAFLQRASRRYLDREATGQESLHLWRALSLNLWMRHLDQPSAYDPGDTRPIHEIPGAKVSGISGT